MGKRIIQQRRGRGGIVYRVQQNAFAATTGYPRNPEGEWEIVKLIPSRGHSAPLAKMMNKKGDIFYNFAANLIYVGQKVNFGGNNSGDFAKLGELKNGTHIFNIEGRPQDGGKFVRTGGNSAIVVDKQETGVKVWLPSKVEKIFDIECRATVGKIAADGRKEKPIVKAGKNYFIKRAKSKLWPRTSAVKMNKIDHPFGSGRGKRIKSKIAKRNSPPGKKVGLIRPRRTGRKKK